MSTGHQQMGKGLDAQSEAELLRLVAKAIRNAREIDLTEDDAARLAWIIYNAILGSNFSIR